MWSVTFIEANLEAVVLIILAWLGHVIWRYATISFWYVFPPSLVVIVFVEVALWMTYRNIINDIWHDQKPCRPMVAYHNILPTKFRKQLLQSYYNVWQKFITKCTSYYKVWQVYYKVRQVLHSVTEVYYKVRQVLQSASGVTKCDRLLLQSASGITKCDRLLLQSASGITKCDSYYKVRSNTLTKSLEHPQDFLRTREKKYVSPRSLISESWSMFSVEVFVSKRINICLIIFKSICFKD